MKERRMPANVFSISKNKGYYCCIVSYSAINDLALQKNRIQRTKKINSKKAPSRDGSVS